MGEDIVEHLVFRDTTGDMTVRLPAYHFLVLILQAFYILDTVFNHLTAKMYSMLSTVQCSSS